MQENCPKCNVDLQGAPIPKKYRHHYHPKTTHYSRKIGIYDYDVDRTTHWRCPDCGHIWKRD